MAKTLLVIVVCDCDPDRPLYGGTRYDNHLSHLKWRGITTGIGSLRDRLAKIEKNTGVRPRLTLCIRSDTQINEIYGSAAWPLEQHSGMWRQLEAEGHEIAWHPHLWRWSSDWRCWYQETQDANWMNECLANGFSDFTRVLGRPPTSCHMGWTFHNNTTMKKISDLGVKIDFSATPGVYFEGGPGDAGTMFDNRIDWLGTPHKWYRPSEADYRRPAGEGENALPIREIPKFTSGAGFLRKAKELAARGKRGPRSAAGKAVFLQITAMPLLYGRIIKERLRREDAGCFFVTYFHPDELLAAERRSAKGFLYSLDHLQKNLIGITESARKRGWEISFATGNDAFRCLAGEKAP